jgi:hypothetical protein
MLAACHAGAKPWRDMIHLEIAWRNGEYAFTTS